MNSQFLFFLGVNNMKKIVFFAFIMIATSVRADWSESYGGDGVVADFIMIARSLVKEMEQDPVLFQKEFIEKLKNSINETLVVSADQLILNGVEKDAINHTLEKPYKIEVSRKKWLQYEISIDIQEKLVLHEYLFTLHIDDSDYITSGAIYRTLLASRMSRNDDSRLGPFLLKAANECKVTRVSSIITLGVNINFTDDDHRNALFMAADAGCDVLVEYFLNMELLGSNPSLKDGWAPWFASFVGAMKNEKRLHLFKKYYNSLLLFSSYIMNPDLNTGAKFNSNDFPLQLDMCEGQSMFMRSLIGINFFTDESKQFTTNVRNLEIIRLLQKNSSWDLKDQCGKSARDYAKKYEIDFNSL